MVREESKTGEGGLAQPCSVGVKPRHPEGKVDCGVRQAWAHVPALPLNSCVSLSKLLGFSDSVFLICQGK